jgi:hypothetical protein
MGRSASDTLPNPKKKIEAKEHLGRQKIPKMLAPKRGNIYPISNPEL